MYRKNFTFTYTLLVLFQSTEDRAFTLMSIRLARHTPLHRFIPTYTLQPCISMLKDNQDAEVKLALELVMILTSKQQISHKLLCQPCQEKPMHSMNW